MIFFLRSPRKSILAWINCHQIIFFAALFFAFLELGNATSFKGESFASFWPASGVYIGVFLGRGRNSWLRIAILGFLINMASDVFLHNVTAFTAAVYSMANLLGALTSVFLFKKFRPFDQFSVFGFPFFAFLFSTIVIGPSVGATFASLLVGFANPSLLWHSWEPWWASEAIGNLVSVPFLVVWLEVFGPEAAIPFSRGSVAEWFLTLGGLAVLSFLIFDNTDHPRFLLQYPFFLFPTLTWVAARYGLRGVTAGFPIVACIAIWEVARGASPFFQNLGSPATNLMILQTYLASLAASAFAMATFFEKKQYYADRLRRLSAKVDGAQEEERKRIAYEVHDHVGQILAVLRMQISALASQPPAEDRMNQVHAAKHLVDEALEGLRSLSRQLRPTVLDNIGLQAAIRDLAVSLGKTTGIRFNLDLEDNVIFDSDVALSLYRILQEALTNIIKHSQTVSSDLSLKLCHRSGAAVLRVQDYGIGMRPEHASFDGLGLLSMRERAGAIGAKFVIRSDVKAGTLIEVNVPQTIHNKKVPEMSSDTF